MNLCIVFHRNKSNGHRADKFIHSEQVMDPVMTAFIHETGGENVRLESKLNIEKMEVEKDQ